MYNLSALDVRFLRRKDVLAVVRAVQSEGGQVFWSVLFYLILEKSLWLAFFFFPLRYKGIKILHVKFGSYDVTASQSLDK